MIDIFPIYTSGKDKNLYDNIFNFLNNGIQNGKRTWPDYINNIKDKKERDSKKTAFCRKIGFYKGKWKNQYKNYKNNKTLHCLDKYYVESNKLYRYY